MKQVKGTGFRMLYKLIFTALTGCKRLVFLAILEALVIPADLWKPRI
jgi:hypothetical protein